MSVLAICMINIAQILYLHYITRAMEVDNAEYGAEENQISKLREDVTINEILEELSQLIKQIKDINKAVIQKEQNAKYFKVADISQAELTDSYDKIVYFLR